MKECDKVSVIIPCFNAERYIEETLESLENQTYNNLEVIIIDDGSTDRSKAVVEKYIEKSQMDIKMVCQENCGVSAARNEGIQLSTGNYICFLDADDVYSPVFVECMVYFAEKNLFVYSYYSRDFQKVKSCSINDVKCKDIPYIDMIDAIMSRKPPVNFWAAIYESSVIKSENLQFSVDLQYGEDFEFMWKYISNMNSGRFVDAPLHGYRFVQTSVSYKRTNEIEDALVGLHRAINYSSCKSKDLSKRLTEFMLPRTKIAIAKQYVQQHNWYSYKSFVNIEWTSADYKKIVKGGDWFVRTAGFLLEFNSYLFYFILVLMIKLEHTKLRKRERINENINC